MGKGSPKIQVTEYFLSQHFGICMGVPDAILDIEVDEKKAFQGEVTSGQVISINRPDLFGGIKREGGVSGLVRYLPGDPAQLLPDALAQKLGRPDGASTPGFRGFASLFFYGSGSRGFYWRANQPILPPVSVRLRRILKRADNSDQWYAEKAEIETCAPLEQETRIRVEWLNAEVPEPGLSYYMTGPGVAFNAEGGDRISEADEATTTRQHYNIVYPFDRIEFVWRGTDGPIGPAEDVQLRMQFSAGSLSGQQKGRVSILQPSMESYQVLFPQPGSDRLADAQGFFDLYNLFPHDTFYDIPDPQGVGAQIDMNPMHIIHECLTDTDWGMGTPVSALDDAAFQAKADTLFNEDLGLSMQWVRQSKVEDFIQEVLDHINGVLYVDPATGLLTPDLIRGDYDPATLDTLTPDNADLSSFSRKLWGEITNEIVVTWTNPENEQEETITVQDDASIGIQGGIISASRNYYGVRCARLAMELAYRDLASDGQPLATLKAIVDRSQYLLRPGSVIKVTWPEKGLTDVVFRVTTVDYGRPGEPEIEVDLIEDVFGQDIGDYDIPASSRWIDPSSAPEPFIEQLAFTLPYFFTINSVLSEFTESPEYPEVGAGILVRSATSDAYEYELWDEVAAPDTSTEWQEITENGIPGSASLDGPLALEAESSGVAFDDLAGDVSPTLGSFVLIDPANEETSEIAMVTAVGATYTLSRGVLDTVPREWPAGTRVWFLDDTAIYEDPTIRSGGELVDYRALMRTSQGRLDFADATTFDHTLTERFWLPLRPANVVVEGVAFSTRNNPIDGSDRANAWVEVTWANRNRLDEDVTVLSWTDANAAPEVGQTTVIEVRDESGNLLTTHDALSGTSFNVPDSSFGTETVIELRVYSSRADGSLVLDSLQYSSHWVRLEGVARSTHDRINRRTHGDDVRLIHA